MKCKSKRSRTSRRPAVKMPASSKNVLPSFYDDLPQKRSSKRIASSRRDKTNKDKLDTNIFELYMEDLWKRIDEDKKSAYTYFDSLWFNSYNSGENKLKILKWVKAKKIFSRQYVFVPIVCWGHWSLLVLCNFGEKNYLDSKMKPRMLLLDSLKTTNPTRLRSAIKRFVVDILKTEEPEDSEQFINEIHLEFPEVPQQTGDECGIYVLFFIYCFLQNEKLGEDFSHLTNYRKSTRIFIHSKRIEIPKLQSRVDGKIAPSILYIILLLGNVTSYSLSFIYVQITGFHLPWRHNLRKLEDCRESVQTESLSDSQHLVSHTKSTDVSILSKSKRFFIYIAYLNVLLLPIQIKS